MNISIIKQIVILLSSSILVACAGSGEARETEDRARADCIYQPSIRGYTVLDESNLIVRASGRRNYHVSLRRRAHGLRSSWGIAFGSPNVASPSRVCSSFGEVRLRGGHFDGESIPIASIRQLTPEEEEDLLIRFGKKEREFEHTPEPQDIEGAEVEELDPAAIDDTSGD